MSEQLASRPGAERKRGSLERGAIRTRRALLVILLLGGIEGGLYLRGLRPSLSFTSEDYEKLVAALTTFGKGLEGIAGHLDALEDMAPPLSEEGTWISDRGGRILVAAGDEPQIQSPIDCEADEKAAEEARLVVEGTAAPIPPGGYQGRFCLPAEEAAKIDYSMEMGVQPREGISASILTN